MGNTGGLFLTIFVILRIFIAPATRYFQKSTLIGHLYRHKQDGESKERYADLLKKKQHRLDNGYDFQELEDVKKEENGGLS